MSQNYCAAHIYFEDQDYNTNTTIPEGVVMIRDRMFLVCRLQLRRLQWQRYLKSSALRESCSWHKSFVVLRLDFTEASMWRILIGIVSNGESAVHVRFKTVFVWIHPFGKAVWVTIKLNQLQMYFSRKLKAADIGNINIYHTFNNILDETIEAIAVSDENVKIMQTFTDLSSVIHFHYLLRRGR